MEGKGEEEEEEENGVGRCLRELRTRSEGLQRAKKKKTGDEVLSSSVGINEMRPLVRSAPIVFK